MYLCTFHAHTISTAVLEDSDIFVELDISVNKCIKTLKETFHEIVFQSVCIMTEDSRTAMWVG